MTVVLATYNGEQFLEEQLRSLAAQESLPHELIASDDGSTDGTLAILHEFAATAPFPVAISQNAVNRGFADNFLSAAEGSTGDLVAFADQDDVWEPEKLRICADFLGRHPAVAVLVHAMQVVDSNGRALSHAYPSVPVTGTAPPLHADPWLLVPGVAVVVDARLLATSDWRQRPQSRDLDALDHQLDHDEWVYLLGWNAGALGFVAQRLVRYRQHEANLFGAPARTRRKQLDRLLRADFATQRNRTAVVRELEGYAMRSQTAGGPFAATPHAVAYWRSYRRLSEHRDAIHTEGRFLVRARRILALAWQRGYASRSGLGRKALLRDARDLLIPSARSQ